MPLTHTGTGKSFIGALLSKILHDQTSETILVICFTNHALDQFLEDLLDIGISPESIVRLGSKCTDRTKPLKITEQQSTYRMSREQYAVLHDQFDQAESYLEDLNAKVTHLRRAGVSRPDLLQYLELSENHKFSDAFTVPDAGDGTKIVGSKGKVVNSLYLFTRWTFGHPAFVHDRLLHQNKDGVWELNRAARQTLLSQWTLEILKERISEIETVMAKYNECLKRTGEIFREKTARIVRSKRIIGCTTTAAAKYTDDLRNAQPGVVLVEEAGEILESHILTALTPKSQQLILIGDHKQLRPKINNYSLTVESGDGYNLNQSLFERLILAGVPHTTLSLQHRMRPEISSLVRYLTYPELQDAPGTQNRPSLRGFQANVILVAHHERERNADQVADRCDQGSRSSKINDYEAEMVLKCVRYIAQQGYNTDQCVVLTPYLGQLSRLREILETENDPILNDMDNHDLVKAGLLSSVAAHVGKRRIRISTIDNYQGEESDIVIASLTRGNDAGDIGFMAAPQRVNVLLSRARNALIIFGNASTFGNSRKGKTVWGPLMEKLKAGEHIFEGLPIKCQRHPNTRNLILKAGDFDTCAPDGGCLQPW